MDGGADKGCVLPLDAVSSSFIVIIVVFVTIVMIVTIVTIVNKTAHIKLYALMHAASFFVWMSECLRAGLFLDVGGEVLRVGVDLLSELG